MSNGTVLTLCGAAVGVSMFYQVRRGNDPIPVMVIGGIFTGACVALTAANPDIGTALAAVFFVGMFISRGSELIDWSTGVVQGANKTQSKTTNTKRKQKTQ